MTLKTIISCVTSSKVTLRVGQGNIFRSVCHSIHMGGLCMMSFPVWLPGPMFLLGGLWSNVPSWGVSVEEDLCPRGLCTRGISVKVVSVWEGLPDMVKSGRYASYWNAFLFNLISETLLSLNSHFHTATKILPKNFNSNCKSHFKMVWNFVLEIPRHLLLPASLSCQIHRWSSEWKLWNSSGTQ